MADRRGSLTRGGRDLRRMKVALAAVTVGALALGAPLAAMPKGTDEFNNNSHASATGCGNNNSLDVYYPAKLWPPNHKYYEDIHVIATDGDNNNADLRTTGTHDQYQGDVEQNGAGHTADDIRVAEGENGQADGSSTATTPAWDEMGTGSVDTNWWARAERSGQDTTGRTYTLTGNATFSDGSCSISVNIVVPHDMRPSNR